MEIRPREIVYYATDEDRVPFIEWLQSTKDITIKKGIRERLNEE